MPILASKKQHLSKEAEIPTASMADIVFLLISFFLITTSMNPDKGLGLTLPPPGEAVKLTQENILTVYINEKGEILIKENIVSLEQVREQVKQRIRENPKLVVSLVTDVKAEYKSMVDVLDEIKLSFQDLKEENPEFQERISLATPAF